MGVEVSAALTVLDEAREALQLLFDGPLMLLLHP